MINDEGSLGANDLIFDEITGEKKVRGAFKYCCASCQRASNSLDLFDKGACFRCGAPNPEFTFIVDGRSFPESALIYFSDDTKADALKFAEEVKKSGIKVITKNEIDFRSISQKDRQLIGDRLGVVFMFPSEQLEREEADHMNFFYEENKSVPEGKLAKTITILSKPENVKYVPYSQHGYGALLQGGNPDDISKYTNRSDRLMVFGADKIAPTLKAVKAQRLAPQARN